MLPPRPRMPGLELSKAVTIALREPRWNAERRAAPSLPSPARGEGQGGGSCRARWRGGLTDPFLGVPLSFFFFLVARASAAKPGLRLENPAVMKPVTTTGFI
jgi:hypothetical protein